ncbi:hypothetical protein [Streptomyces tsukubensis]|uniref:hypothetical protein n=1 Tax=Streptomyces tsukubensis TaxID=83656 RepID=UPI001D054DE2|nr:hypothetical protein [Streptomyces tsukubensis]
MNAGSAVRKNRFLGGASGRVWDDVDCGRAPSGLRLSVPTGELQQVLMRYAEAASDGGSVQ